MISIIKDYSKDESPLSQAFNPGKILLELDVEAYCRSLTAIERGVLNYLIWLYKSCPYVYISQITLAQRLGCSRKSINRAIGQLCRDEVIEKKRRFNTSSVYRVISFFSLGDIRYKLRKWLPALLALPLSLLGSFRPKVTLTNTRVLGIKYYKSFGSQERAMRVSDFVPQYVDRLQFRRCRITTWGKIKLLAFPEDAISRCWPKLQAATGVEDEYAYLMKLLLNDKETYKYQLDWGTVVEIGARCDVKSGDPVVEPITVKPPKEFKNMAARVEKKEPPRYCTWQGHTRPEREKPILEPLTQEQEKRASLFRQLLGI